MAITAVTTEQDNKIDGADLMAVHSPLVFTALATHDGTAPDNLKATIVNESRDCSIYLNGTDAYMYSSLLASEFATAFTYCVWVKTTNLTDDMAIMSSINETTIAGMEVHIVAGYPTVTCADWSNYIDNTSSVAVVSGTWTHIAATWDGVTSSIYVNGVLTGTAATVMQPGIGQIFYGARHYPVSNFFEGQIDESRLYNSVCDVTRINAIMNDPLSGYESDLMAGYNFNQGYPGTPSTSTPLYYDCSGNGYNATNVNITGNIEVGYFGTSPEILASYYCIPVDDPSTTQRRFALQASNLLKNEMDSFDDEILDSADTPTLLSGRVKRLVLYFHDPANSYSTAPYDSVGMCVAHAAREFGEAPCMSDQFDNTANTTVYGCIGFYAYIYMYNNSAATSVTVAQLTPTASAGVTTYGTEAGYYGAKVLVTQAEQTFGWYRSGTLIKTVTVKGVLGSCVDSQMLKFLDRAGLYRIYPFSRHYTKSTSPSQIGSVNKLLTSILTDQSNVSNIGYTANREVILKQYVDYQELDFIESLYESPRVYYYVGDGSSDTTTDWLEVTVKAGGDIYRGKNLTGTEEITVTLPKHYTQTML